MNPKEHGEIAELRFYLMGFDLGFVVSKPFGDSQKYDFITDWNGILKRVQVKSTSVLQKTKKCDKYRVSCASGASSKYTYTEKEIDLLAAYVVPLDVWYLIPIDAIGGHKTIALYPHKSFDGKYEIYKNKWDMLNHN